LLICAKYYIFTKDPLPMDVEFVVQDTYSLVRPQWKIASDLEEAARLFSEAIAQNYKVQDGEKAVEPEEDEVESLSSDDGNVDEGLEEDGVPDIDEQQSSTEEAEVSVFSSVSPTRS
jgi:regulator of nonsense transcripts 2